MKITRLLTLVVTLTLLLIGATLITRADSPTPTPTSTPTVGSVGQGLQPNKPCYEALDQRCVPEPTVTPTPEPVPAAPTLNPIGNYGPGTFTVSWSAVPYGVRYVLDESTDHVNWTDVYRGPATSWTPTNHANGIYYYRVFAQNHQAVYWGGPWSNVQQAVVVPWMPDGPQVNCVNVGPTTIRCRIDEPYVKQRMTSYYPYVTFQPGDWVQIDAGGCVQTGGSGLTWKRYVDPEPSDLHYGLLHIPGQDNTPALSTLYTEIMRVPLNDTNPLDLHLELGYKDNYYDDNGYYAHDNGTRDQCWSQGTYGVGNAWVVVQIDRGPNRPAPMPKTGMRPQIEYFTATPQHIRRGDPTTLSWRIKYCDQGCDIWLGYPDDELLEAHLSPVGSSGHRPGDTTTYRLIAQRPGAGISYRDVEVKVDQVLPPTPTPSPALPDLYIPYNDTDPTFPKADQPFTVKFTVCNAGGAPSGPFIMHMWRDANDDGHTKDINEPSFAPGHCEDITWDQAGLPADGYVFSALVDWTNVVNEGSEANNQSEMYLGLVAP